MLSLVPCQDGSSLNPSHVSGLGSFIRRLLLSRHWDLFSTLLPLLRQLTLALLVCDGGWVGQSVWRGLLPRVVVRVHLLLRTFLLLLSVSPTLVCVELRGSSTRDSLDFLDFLKIFHSDGSLISFTLFYLPHSFLSSSRDVRSPSFRPYFYTLLDV